LKAFSETKKKLEAGEYRVEAIPDMADPTGKRFDYLTEKLKNK
jgi:glycine C-acetyltransferase